MAVRVAYCAFFFYNVVELENQCYGNANANAGDYMESPLRVQMQKSKFMIKGKKVKVNGRDFVIGVDGGGVDTVVALADMEGKIVARAVSGASSPRNGGIVACVKNVAEGIGAVLKNKKNIKIVSTFIGLPAMEEEYKNRKSEIIRELKKNKKIIKIFNGKTTIGSDQLAAFRSGANGQDGIVAICGAGVAVHGWNNGKELIINNKGWLVDKGSGNWIGRHAARAIAEAADGRGLETKLTGLVFKKFKFKDINDLLKFVYENPTVNLPKLAVLCDAAASDGDKVAREILVGAGKEIALAVRVAAAKLLFSEQVPLVLAGGVYKSRWVADTAMNEISRYYPGKFDFVVVADPVAGAVKLALEARN